MTPPAPPARRSLGRRDFLSRTLAFLGGAALLGRVSRLEASTMGLDPYIGAIILFGGGFAPRGWAFCNGQLLPIAQNQALFSLLGTTYGGNGQTTFALPDLRGRVPIHFGQGPGLSDRALGQQGGAASHTLVLGELPAHSHVARASSVSGTTANPSGQYFARNAAQYPQWGGSLDSGMAPGAIAIAGGSQAHSNLQPTLAMNYIIALQGLYPPH